MPVLWADKDTLIVPAAYLKKGCCDLSTPPTLTESSVPNANSCTSKLVAEDLNIFLVGF